MIEQGVGGIVELGAGKVLSGLARRIDRHVKALSIGAPDEADVFLRKLTDVEN